MLIWIRADVKSVDVLPVARSRKVGDIPLGQDQPKDELADIKSSNSDRDLDNAISSC
jgi:hypothetical protein